MKVLLKGRIASEILEVELLAELRLPLRLLILLRKLLSSELLLLLLLLGPRSIPELVQRIPEL